MIGYTHLIGKTKKEVLQEMGYEFNHYPSDIWTYVLKRNWLGRKKTLVLYFKECIVEHVAVHHLW